MPKPDKHFAITQLVTRRLLSAEVTIRSQSNPYGIWGRSNGIGAGF